MNEQLFANSLVDRVLGGLRTGRLRIQQDVMGEGVLSLAKTIVSKVKCGSWLWERAMFVVAESVEWRLRCFYTKQVRLRSSFGVLREEA